MYSKKNKHPILQNELVKSEKMLKRVKRKKNVKKARTNLVQSNNYQLKKEIKNKLRFEYKYNSKKYITDNLSKIKKIKIDLQEIEKINVEQKLMLQVSYEENLQIKTDIENIKDEVKHVINRNKFLYESLFLLEEEVEKREKEVLKPKGSLDIPFELNKLEKQIGKIIKDTELVLNGEGVGIVNEIEQVIKEKITPESFSYPNMDENTLKENIIFIEQKIGDNLFEQRDIYKKVFHLEHKQLDNDDKIIF